MVLTRAVFITIDPAREFVPVINQGLDYIINTKRKQ